MSKEKGNNNSPTINKGAKKFAKYSSLKKFKKEYGDKDMKKKVLIKSHALFLIDYLPDAIDFVVRYGHIQDRDVQETKAKIYEVLASEDFVKVLREEIKGGAKIENIILLPIIIRDIIQKTQKENARLLAENPESKIYDMSDEVKLSQLILKKKLKKFDKEGIAEDLAFDCLSVIPDDKILASSQNYRIKMLMDVLYEKAKTEKVPFEKIVDVVFGEAWYPVICVFALLERKEKFGTLTDEQKVLYLDISNWVFNTMEKKLDKDELSEVLNVYVRSRRRDESRGKDGNRRYVLSTLSEQDYPNVTSFIKKLIASDDTLKKYL